MKIFYVFFSFEQKNELLNNETFGRNTTRFSNEDK
jgi:hypothetical protein